MGLKIVISSAVELDEKTYVKEKLREMEKLHVIKIDDLYDCAEHATYWGVKSKQEVINRKILDADWFICLIPEQTVGEATWGELKLILEAQKARIPIAISIFHPIVFPKEVKDAVTPKGRVSFDYIKEQAEIILGNKEEQYWITFHYNDKEDLQKVLNEEFIKLYYVDKVFRTQHLNNFAKLGCRVKARDLYFDKERANIDNGFIENKYFPRRSVDGKLQEALIEHRKFTVILGAPGSGKTRAIYQLLASPQQLSLANQEHYALGTLANQNIIIVNQDNVHHIYHFLESENDYDDSEDVLSEYFLLCDQLKDVFGMLTNEELFRFFDMVTQYKHVHMIATSIPSAFSNFCERWKNYGRKPLEDDQRTKVITIPLISSDDEEIAMRNWMLNELQGNSTAETIGDYIPKLNSYKQSIVKKLYGKIGVMPYLAEILSSFQIIETYRHDTALFLPILTLRKNIYPKEKPTNWNEFNKDIVKTLNFLIANNVIWVREFSNKNNQETMVVKKMQTKAFSLEYGMDDYEEFWFDDEEFIDTPISTAYTYGVNEIVWNELELEDANRHISQSETLLKDFQNAKDVIRAAKEFYRAFPSIKSLRRILPRIPHTDCYDEVAKVLWNFVYMKCIEIVPDIADQEEFIVTISMLIGRSKDLSQVKDAISILQKKGIRPNYNIIGELYSVSLHLGKEEAKLEITSIVTDIRNNYQLHHDNFFSIARKIFFLDMSFEDALNAILYSKYEIHQGNNVILLPLPEAVHAIEHKIDLASLGKLLLILTKKGETVEQWMEAINLHKLLNVNLRRSIIHQFFSVVADQNKNRLQEKDYKESENLMRSHLQTLIDQFDNIIADEDKESCYFYSAEASWNFQQAYSIYLLYVDKYNKDNPRLISTVLGTVRNHEFQKALNFLIEVDERFKSRGLELNNICFNNLIKSAPNMGEALGVVPYITHIQDHTLANILSILKSKRRIKDNNAKTGKKQDSKIFYYAYSAFMRSIFFEQRKSPYIIGLLYDLATTPKHERFIRETFLSHLEERKKREIIDYSTGISSIRLKKNYRTIEEVWEIFNTCRNHYRDEKMYINSELYSNLMRKVQYLCKTDESLTQQQEKIRTIINEDYGRIIRDEYFFSSLYRFFPEKQVIDSEGNISRDFVKEMILSEISLIKPLNNIMRDLKTKGFNIVWNFYEFIVKYYHDNGKRKSLRPDLRTVTYLMETVTTKEQFEKAENAAKLWCLDAVLINNKLYCEAYAAKRRELGLDTPNNNEKKKKTVIIENSNSSNIKKGDYIKRTDEIVGLALKDIYLNGNLTPTLFNLYLKKTCDIIEDIIKDQHITPVIAKKRKGGTYRNILTNLIEKYPNNICFDAISYVYLIKLSPTEWDVKRWITELKEKESIYKYDMVVCATISQSAEVCKADIDTALDYFEFWEDIVQDIGYDPADPTSFSEITKVTKYNNKDDYDGYWLTRSTHCIREMNHFWCCLKQRNGFVDKTALRFIRRQMDLFNQYGVSFPKLIIKGHEIDFNEEIKKHKNQLVE